MDKGTSVGVAIITHNAKHHLAKCLPPLLASSLHPRVLVVNSSSSDGTVEEAKRFGTETLVIPRKTFNHGTTREQARHHLGTDIVVMLTPDAYAQDHLVLEKLVEPIITGKASVTYARQIPHEGADFFESFSRAFNYPTQSHTRTIDAIETYGIYTFFCSNSCAAYSNAALDEIGGFQHVLLGEDTVAVAKLLKRGHKIAYVADAVVQHSHRYTLIQEFQRHFDTGIARKSYQDLLLEKDTARGKTYVQAMLKALARQNPLMLPYACMQILAKWLGYRLGRACTRAPRWLKKTCSSQDFYW